MDITLRFSVEGESSFAFNTAWDATLRSLSKRIIPALGYPEYREVPDCATVITSVNDQSLTPGDHPRLGPTRFEDWLRAPGDEIEEK